MCVCVCVLDFARLPRKSELFPFCRMYIILASEQANKSVINISEHKGHELDIEFMYMWAHDKMSC